MKFDAMKAELVELRERLQEQKQVRRQDREAMLGMFEQILDAAARDKLTTGQVHDLFATFNTREMGKYLPDDLNQIVFDACCLDLPKEKRTGTSYHVSDIREKVAAARQMEP